MGLLTGVYFNEYKTGITDGANTVSIITDIAFINNACTDKEEVKDCTLPTGTSIGVSVKLGNTFSEDAPTPE
ncbi:hypothetical protein [Nitrosococcus halophilus]|uniref:hypothetical protein n=1 Tax=Nitrosococcus halophilus TaxID=133539 RepID=UPI0012FF1049|nr:hypothetical protein [Nitrosococcus halophilus]